MSSTEGAAILEVRCVPPIYVSQFVRFSNFLSRDSLLSFFFLVTVLLGSGLLFLSLVSPLIFFPLIGGKELVKTKEENSF